MTDLDKMARDILDSIPDAAFGTAAEFTGHAYVVLGSEARYAIRAALLTAPPGWKLVPVEPTPEMVDAAREHHEGEAYLPVSLYRAMLAAAPEVK